MIYSSPITEDDLHGYIDHALDPARRAAVQIYLETHPDVASRIAAYEYQRDALKSALLPIAEEPIPPQLNPRHAVEQMRRAWIPPWRSMAAAVLLLVAGGAGGWALRGIVVSPSEVNGIAALAQEAAYTYGVYGSDPIRPVEFGATDKAQLISWISGRLGSTISIPDLAASGYRFMGGRLVATPHGPAGLLMYDNALGQHLALLLRPMGIDKDTRMSEHSFGDVRGFAWSSKGMGFSVVGTATADLLHPVANEVRRQEASKI